MRSKPWNKGKAVGPKRAFTEDQIKALRYALTAKGMVRDLALFETALSTMLRSGDLLALKVEDVQDAHLGIYTDITVKMEKTDKQVLVSIAAPARKALQDLIAWRDLKGPHYLFTAYDRAFGEHLSTTAYRTMVKEWCRLIHLDPREYSTHSLRRTRPSIIYKKTGNLRAIQLLLGHSDIGMTQRYLGIDEQDALALAAEHEV